MTDFLTGYVRRAWDGWSDFWFGEKNLNALAFFRISICGTMFLMYLSRQFDVLRYYGENTFVSREMSWALVPKFYQMSFQWFFWPDSLAVMFHGIFVLSLLALTLGIGGRVLCLVAWVLHMGFLYRNYSVAFGADLISGIFLLYLAGTQSCARWSLLNLFRSRTGQPVVSDLATNVFYRLIQVQLCVIYAFTGFEKLKGGTWWDGTALWTVFANSQLTAFDFTFMRHLPTAVALLTFSTIVLEIYLPLAIWIRKVRIPVLLAGISFHVGIAIVMALPTFAAVMMAPYWLFLSTEDFAAVEAKIESMLRRWLPLGTLQKLKNG